MLSAFPKLMVIVYGALRIMKFVHDFLLQRVRLTVTSVGNSLIAVFIAYFQKRNLLYVL